MKANTSRKIFTLVNRQYITPHYIRLTLTHPEVDQFKETTIGVNNKIFLAPKGCSTIEFGQMDPQTKKVVHQDPSKAAIMRTYTHRGIDLDKKEIIIDFVAHGSDSPASDFAINAPIGAPLGVAMGVVKKELYPQANWYVLAGDATAIPVLGAILESLPSNVKADVILEVESLEDIQTLNHQCQAEITWLINPTPGVNTQLIQKVKDIVDNKNHQESKFGYLASEMQSIKALRHYFRKEKGWSANELYAYSYWKYGNAETDSVLQRREEKNSIE
ncbi:siderophore-interacting protein [Myroides sp. LJL116]